MSNTITRRRFSLLASATAVTLALAGGQAAAADFTMRVSHQFPPTHHTSKALEQFAAEVQKETKGRVEVQLFGSGQLYKPNQNHVAVATGKVEAAAIVNISLAGTIPEMNVTIIPYFITSLDKIRKFPQSEAARYLDQKMADKGLTNIAWIVDTADGIFTSAKSPLIKPADFKGVKIRGLSKMFDAGLIAMGAAPSAMPGSEVYQALQTGVIDAGFTGVAAAYERKFYEVQKYGAASNIILAYEVLVVNPAWWKSLPEDLRKVLASAASKMSAKSVPSSSEISPEDVKRLRDNGMEVTVLTPEQEKAMAAAMQPASLQEFRAASPDAQKLIEMVEKL